ncbi:hypothetical protein H4R18_004854 [Coemansia javaensis]|uniref:Major facilitator superfamily (MFS) profile domain-containing protein n=1 Tax=Coemansia javaensis TaxID=2761396 RepID=A0A9W8HAF9_9FUNG|nr:hypothetical protein H4R18_004854 [Coemansia javaensis]
MDTLFYSLTVAMLPDVLQNGMHAPKSANGLVTTVFGIGNIVGCAVSGHCSDRLRNRRAMQTLVSLVYMTAGAVFFCAGRFHEILVFRTINGFASGVACTLAFATIGDVYPENLLGFKAAVMYFGNNIAYTIGPICGQRLFDLGGVRGPAVVVIALSLLRFVIFAVVAEDSLVIRGAVIRHPAAAQPRCTPASGDPSAAKEEACGADEIVDTTSELDNAAPGRRMSFWRLLASAPVVIATLSIASCMGIQGMLEGLVPLHLIDSFGREDDSGTTFVILGLSFTVLAPAVGWVLDATIARGGETMRYVVMLFGAVSMILDALLLSLARTYAALMAGVALFALTNLCMLIPAVSAYGDIVNAAGSDAMARGYAIAGCAWAVGSAVIPAIASALYSRLGFAAPVMGISVAACTASAAAFLGHIGRRWYLRRKCLP